MKKIMIVFGTRPEAIKMVPIIKQIEKSEELEGIVCATRTTQRYVRWSIRRI